MKKMNFMKKFFYCLRPGILITCFFCMFVIAGCKTGTDGKDGIDGKDGVDGINGKDGVDGLSINWRGSYESEEEITNPKYLDAYYNIKTGCSYIFDGEKWTLLAKAGLDGKDSIDGKDGVNGFSITWRGSYESEEEISNPKYLDVYYNINTGCSYIFDGKKWTLLAKAGLNGKDGIDGKNLVEETISNPLKLILLNDSEENVLLTADYAPIKVCIPNTCQVTKVVWKKGTANTKVDPYTLLNDSAAENIILDFSNTAIFYVSENGWYDVAAQDTLGRCEWNQIEVKTIDTTPLGEVKNLVASTKDRTATVAWKDVSTSEKYNSPLKSVKITYIYNDNENDSNNGSLLVDVGVETAGILIPRAKTSEDFLRIKVQTVDELGNISEGVKVITWCSNSVYATEANFAERLMSMTTSGEIAVVGECDITVITTAMRKLCDEKPDIMIDLDLSEIVGWTSIGGDVDKRFEDCTNLSSVILPESLTSIEEHAFDSTSITTIIIPDSVNKICGSAFGGCRKLENVKMPRNLTYIGGYAFSSCSSLKEITIPKNVTRIGPEIFKGTSVQVIFEDNVSIWYKTTKQEFIYGIEIGPMNEINIQTLFDGPTYRFYNQNYQAE